MSKKIYLLFTFLILTGAVIFVFSKKIKDYENSVISQIEKSFGANIVVNDGISYKFFGITLNNVKILRYSGEISSNLSCVEINFKKLPLFLLKFQVASIKLKGGQVNLKSCKTIRYDLPYKLLLEDINFRVYRFLLDMHIKEGVYRSSNGTTQLSAALINKEKKEYKFFGFKDYNKKESEIHFHSPDEHLDFTFDHNTNKVSGAGKDIMSLLRDFTIFKNTSNQKSKFEINGVLDSASDEFAISVKSELVDFFINYSRSENGYKLDFESENINLDALKPANFRNTDLTEYFEYVISQDANYVGNFKIDNLVLGGKDITKVQSSIFVKNGKAKIDSLTAQLPDEVMLDLKGDIASSANFSQFHGNLTVEGNASADFLEWIDIRDNDFASGRVLLDTKLIIGPQMLILSDAKIKSPFLDCNASVNYKKGTIESKIRGEIELIGLDFDNSSLIEKLKLKIKALNTNYTNLRLKLKDLKLNQKIINQINVNFNSEEGRNISFFDIKSKNSNFNGKLLIGGRSNEFNITIAGESLDLDLIKLPSLLKLEPKNKSFKPNWSTENLHNIDESVNANIVIDIEQINLGEDKISDFSFKGFAKDGKAGIEKLKFYQGAAEFELFLYAAISQYSNALRANFIIKNLNADRFLKDFLKVGYASGYFNLAGELASSGQNIKELVDNLSGSLRINGSAVKIDGVDFLVLSSELQKVKSQDQLDSITRMKVFNNSTKFKSLSGASNIKNGILATSLNFLTETTSGAISSNFSLSDMEVNGVAKVFFIAPDWGGDVADVDINFQGSIWQPKVFFDNNKVYQMIQDKSLKSNAS